MASASSSARGPHRAVGERVQRGGAELVGPGARDPHDPGAGPGDGGGVGRLIPAERDAHLRQPVGQRGQHGAEPGVVDDEVGVGQHRGVAHVAGAGRVGREAHLVLGQVVTAHGQHPDRRVGAARRGPPAPSAASSIGVVPEADDHERVVARRRRPTGVGAGRFEHGADVADVARAGRSTGASSSRGLVTTHPLRPIEQRAERADRLQADRPACLRSRCRATPPSSSATGGRRRRAVRRRACARAPTVVAPLASAPQSAPGSM